jgi:hypothetical protein
MTDRTSTGRTQSSPVVLALPFHGRWLTQNSPARRVPSHGTDLFGETYAIDFLAVDDRHRTARSRDWRTYLATEPADRFFAFGRPLLAPADGTVVHVHDGEVDHAARRAQLRLLGYALNQQNRLRQGIPAIAGNYLIIELQVGNGFIALVHLRAGTLRVAVGDAVRTGQQIAECGNSGNSTQPHVHVQMMDSIDLSVARGIPIAFRNFREWPRGRGQDEQVRELGLPGEGALVEPIVT